MPVVINNSSDLIYDLCFIITIYLKQLRSIIINTAILKRLKTLFSKYWENKTNYYICRKTCNLAVQTEPLSGCVQEFCKLLPFHFLVHCHMITYWKLKRVHVARFILLKYTLFRGCNVLFYGLHTTIWNFTKRSISCEDNCYSARKIRLIFRNPKIPCRHKVLTHQGIQSLLLPAYEQFLPSYMGKKTIR